MTNFYCPVEERIKASTIGHNWTCPVVAQGHNQLGSSPLIFTFCSLKCIWKNQWYNCKRQQDSHLLKQCVLFGVLNNSFVEIQNMFSQGCSFLGLIHSCSRGGPEHCYLTDLRVFYLVLLLLPWLRDWSPNTQMFLWENQSDYQWDICLQVIFYSPWSFWRIKKSKKDRSQLQRLDEVGWIK